MYLKIRVEWLRVTGLWEEQKVNPPPGGSDRDGCAESRFDEMFLEDTFTFVIGREAVVGAPRSSPPEPPCTAAEVGRGGKALTACSL